MAKAVAKELTAGSPCPGFSVAIDGGGTLSSDQLKGKRLVLYFYPRDDTAGCTAEALAFSKARPAFDRAACAILGISRDSVAAHERFKKKHGLTIQLGSDESGAMSDAFGVWVEKSLYGRYYMGIERTTLLIDARGDIQHIWRKVKVPGHVDSVLAALMDLDRDTKNFA